MTNFRTMVPETIETLNRINSVIESCGYKLLLLSSTVSPELKSKVLKIPFSLKEYSKLILKIDSTQYYNNDLIDIDIEFNDDKNADREIYKIGIQKCIAVAHKIAEIVKPAFAFLWSGTVPQSIIFKSVFSSYFIPTFFAERGLLPETLMFDLNGNGAFSSQKFEIGLANRSENLPDNFETIKKYYFNNRIDKHEQKEYESSQDYISKNNLAGKKILFFAGQWDVASGVNSANDYQSFCNSPYFKNTEEAFLHLSSIISQQTERVLIFKPHPFDKREYSENRDKGIIVERNANIHTLIESAEVVAAMSTTVQYEVLLYEKPLLLIGNSLLNGWNACYELRDVNHLQQLIEDAFNKEVFDKKTENAKRFINFISDNYLIKLNHNNPAGINIDEYFSYLLKSGTGNSFSAVTEENFSTLLDNVDKMFKTEKTQQEINELIMLSEDFINKGEIKRAKQILSDILTIYDPNSIDAANNYAVTELLDGNIDSANSIIRQILDKDPQNEIALGNLDYILQELPQEVTTFKESQKSDDNNEQSSNDSEKSKTQIIKEHWDNVSNTKSSHNFRWWGSPTIWNHYNRLTSGDEGGLIQLLKQKLNGGVLEKGVSVGCGIGVTEMKLILEGVVSHFDLYELSEVRIKQGLQRAKELNILDKIAYHNEDVFQSIEKETVELVYWYDSLHHMFDVDEAVKWCRQILKNDGFFCMNEYTGPSRFQFSDKSLEIATAIRSALPTKYMVDPRNGSHFSRICYKPSAQALAQDDPSEAADSSRIIKSIQKYFPHAEIKKLGGIVYMRVLDDIICNFNENNKEDLLLLKSLLEIDKALIQFPDVDNLYSAVVVQKTKY
ncbi:MAG: hypothetical protein CO129_07120 [Ignavibacteriales bacterium CG_4_9_14_3_um_filter_34_10]|nr:MAG: hypothetical protein CO129_07120 [Ignavibacteriales bacterium CG_4_9_14_3_um_filter_34_10]